MRLVHVDGSSWGGWHRQFVQSFLSRGWTSDNLESPGEFLAGEDAFFAVHHMAAGRPLLEDRSDIRTLGAYVHCLSSFPFTVGFRDDPDELWYLEQFDKLFVATLGYADHLVSLGIPSSRISVVGYPFEWANVVDHHLADKRELSAAIAQRHDPDNNPFVALRIAHEAGLDDVGVFISAGGALSSQVEAAADGLGFNALRAFTHREFLKMLAQNEWLISASHGESFGVLFVEAVALGLNVCAPRVEGLTELFDSGTLYSPFSVKGAAGRIKMGEPARLRDHVRTFHNANVVVERIRAEMEA